MLFYAGAGHAVLLMAKSFPQSSFFGFEMSRESIQIANEKANQLGLKNVTFDTVDVTDMTPSKYGKFDLITAFDVIHDLKDPKTAVQNGTGFFYVTSAFNVMYCIAVYECLVDGGTFFMMDIMASSNLEDNIENPMGAFLYRYLFVCYCFWTHYYSFS